MLKAVTWTGYTTAYSEMIEDNVCLLYVEFLLVFVFYKALLDINVLETVILRISTDYHLL